MVYTIYLNKRYRTRYFSADTTLTYVILNFPGTESDKKYTISAVIAYCGLTHKQLYFNDQESTTVSYNYVHTDITAFNIPRGSIFYFTFYVTGDFPLYEFESLYTTDATDEIEDIIILNYPIDYQGNQVFINPDNPQSIPISVYGGDTSGASAIELPIGSLCNPSNDFSASLGLFTYIDYYSSVPDRPFPGVGGIPLYERYDQTNSEFKINFDDYAENDSLDTTYFRTSASSTTAPHITGADKLRLYDRTSIAAAFTTEAYARYFVGDFNIEVQFDRPAGQDHIRGIFVLDTYADYSIVVRADYYYSGTDSKPYVGHYSAGASAVHSYVTTGLTVTSTRFRIIRSGYNYSVECAVNGGAYTTIQTWEWIINYNFWPSLMSDNGGFTSIAGYYIDVPMLTYDSSTHFYAFSEFATGLSFLSSFNYTEQPVFLILDDCTIECNFTKVSCTDYISLSILTTLQLDWFNGYIYSLIDDSITAVDDTILDVRVVVYNTRQDSDFADVEYFVKNLAGTFVSVGVTTVGNSPTEEFPYAGAVMLFCRRKHTGTSEVLLNSITTTGNGFYLATEQSLIITHTGIYSSILPSITCVASGTRFIGEHQGHMSLPNLIIGGYQTNNERADIIMPVLNCTGELRYQYTNIILPSFSLGGGTANWAIINLPSLTCDLTAQYAYAIIGLQPYLTALSFIQGTPNSIMTVLKPTILIKDHPDILSLADTLFWRM